MREYEIRPYKQVDAGNSRQATNAFILPSRVHDGLAPGEAWTFALCETQGAICEVRGILVRCPVAIRVSVPACHTGPVLCKVKGVPSETQNLESHAALSCYTFISIATSGILSVATAGAVFGQAAARGRIATDISSIVGTRDARAIETIILNARNPGSGIRSNARPA